MNELQIALAQPFAPSAITWKPGASKENKCMAMAYADLRAYMERLDDICGMEWTSKYEPWGDNRIIAHLTIAGITRCSTGEMEAQDEKSGIGGTVAEAQAFKRAAAMFGLGRYLYDLPSVWVEFDAQRKRITEAGQRELDTRYKDWYKRATQNVNAPRNGSNGHNHTPVAEITIVAPANPFESDTPTDEEHDILSMWMTNKDAYVWAVNSGACDNIFEAKNSMAKIVTEHGGRTDENGKSIALAYLRKQMAKLQAAELVEA